MKVICESAGRLKACLQCMHAVEHDDKWPTPGDLMSCTTAMPCEGDEEMVKCVPVKEEKGGDMDEQSDGLKDQEKATRRRKSSNYALERKEDLKDEAKRDPMWEQVKDGFASPELALEFVFKTKLTGTFRAVRVASDEYESTLVTPEPVLTVKKVKKAKGG